jgi:hypothetical protein
MLEFMTYIHKSLKHKTIDTPFYGNCLYQSLRVFENRMMRKIFEPKRDEVIGGWRKLHDELHNLYCSQSIIRMIKSRRMRWAGHVA